MKSACAGLSFTWDGKQAAAAQAESKTGCRLFDEPARSCHGKQSASGRTSGALAANAIIEGDNLDALKLLAAETAGEVDFIYIDPPYNTGNSFVYHDALEHAAWLNMMYPRLLLARRLLAESGVFFISIDDNELDKLRLVMSEIFGERNFVAQITVRSNPRGRQAERHFARVHEYLLVFAKDAAQLQLSGLSLTEEQASQFDRTDSEGRRYRLLGLRQRGAHSLQEDRPAMHFPIYVDPKTASISLFPTKKHTEAVVPKKSTGQAGRWMWGRQRTAQMLHLLEAKLIRSRNEFDIFVRDYLDDDRGELRTRKVTTIWDEKELNYQNGKRVLKELLGRSLLDYPKPPALLRKALSVAGKPDALCLDFFAGSGTLGQAVLEANACDGGSRRFILVQVAEPTGDSEFPTIADICRRRMEEVVRALPNSPGFRYVTCKPG